MNRQVLIASGLALMVLIGAPVIAHHASAPFYDPEDRVEISGTITRFVFETPMPFSFWMSLMVAETR